MLDGQILGIAGRMVRTRGPWRCVFSRGQDTPAPAPAPASPSPSCDIPPRPASEAPEEGLAADVGSHGGGNGGAVPGGVPDGVGGDRESSSAPREAVDEGASAAGVDGPIPAGGLEKSGDENGRDPVEAVGRSRVDQRGPPPGSDNGSRPDSSGARSDGAEAEASPEGVGLPRGPRRRSPTEDDDGDSAEQGAPEEDELGPPDALRAGAAEEGVLYLNQRTGETSRDAPPELVSLSEEAERAGEYLVFVPCRSFVRAVRSRALVAAGGGVPGSAPLSARREGVEAAGDSNAEVSERGAWQGFVDKVAVPGSWRVNRRRW